MSVPAAYLGIILIWSTTPLAIKWSSEGVGFLFGVTARMAIAVVLCLVLVRLLRIAFPWNRAARRTYFVAGLGLYGAMMAVYWGAQYISSGLVSVVYGLLPLVTTLLATLWLKQGRLDGTKLMGVVLALGGLVVIFDPRVEPEFATLLGIGGVLLSTLLHAISMLGVQRFGTHLHPLAVTTGGLSIAVPLYLLTCVLVNEPWPQVIPQQSLSAILYLSVMGSVVGFVLFYYVLKNMAADVIALITLITPVCALGLGHFLNGEVLEVNVLIGTAFILLGLMVHHWGSHLRLALTR